MTRMPMELAGKKFVITEHATARILEMGIHPDEIRAALENPANTHQPTNYPGSEYWDHGRITVVIREETPGIHKVTTVLWACDDLWREDLLRDGNKSDRIYKPNHAPISPYALRKKKTA